MARRLPAKVSGILLALAAFSSLGVFTTTTTTTAQAATEFTCPAKTVCLFPNDNLTGNYPAFGGPAELATNGNNGAWTSFASDGISPNPGSMHVNANSCVWVFDKQLDLFGEAEPNSTDALDGTFGFFFIQLGVDPCPSSPPPGAP